MDGAMMGSLLEAVRGINRAVRQPRIQDYFHNNPKNNKAYKSVRMLRVID